jgi:hypothetical protein
MNYTHFCDRHSTTPPESCCRQCYLKTYRRNQKVAEYRKQRSERQKAYCKDYASKKGLWKTKYIKTDLQKANNAAYKSKWTRQKLNTDPAFKLKSYLRRRLNKILKSKDRSLGLNELIGCSNNDLKIHMEKQFLPGMSWDNYGKWHCDHIKPLDSFSLSGESDLKAAWHYTNLQPLWAKDNMSKGSKIL